MAYDGPLPDAALRDFTPNQRRDFDVPVRVTITDASPSSSSARSRRNQATQVGCGVILILLSLIALTIAGLVVYISLNEARISRLEDKIDGFKDAVPPLSSSAVSSVTSPGSRLRMDALLEKTPAAALPRPSAQAKVLVAAKPKWARNLSPQWLQFETPVEGGVFRLPPSGGHRGLYQAHDNGYTLDCVFGERNTQPARSAIKLTFHLNDEDGQEYAEAEVVAPAFRGRECAIEWMGE